MSTKPEFGSEEDIRELFIEFYGDEGPKSKGAAMKLIRDEYGSDVDLNIAAKVLNEMYGV